ncbi:glycosyltransferase [Pelomonas sp. SE-A7]|uniref:glycosyltransferase n=1 Tax=Pelomonas sp. SE-A7 TaxID=3054953 RepID=UPI00259D3172|nr:glycosyltransferase [Pelomonas sp. SE-A7]MDM4767531.1 glycosyltransferase [Pelomonas sp. SE-A7]
MTAGRRLLLHAPNVHTGGGLVLLQQLLDAWPAQAPLIAWLDQRAKAALQLPAQAEVSWVSPSLASRLGAEVSLARRAKADDRVLCFHGLPPLLCRAEAQLFLQNRNYLGQVPLDEYGWRTRWRNRAEQWISRLYRSSVSCYYVQSPTMARALQAWFGSEPAPLRVLPFVPDLVVPASGEPLAKPFDFVFVADGEPHKNHRRLVEAWQLLAGQGLKPRLAVTLSDRHAALRDWVMQQASVHGLAIHNLPQRPHHEMPQFYADAHALIFPSLGESFGLPLVEAQVLGLPIVASERDYVRDICHPAETFDPESAVSIARAVRRFLQRPEALQAPLTAAEFLSRIDGGEPR